MSNSSFGFISNEILRQNLDESFDHIVNLLPLIESGIYSDAAARAFRKTCVIYTASIIEALLFHIIDTQLSDEDLTDYTWKLSNKKRLFLVDDTYEIVAGDYKKEGKLLEKDKLNLGQICKILKDKKILTKSLFEKIDKVRILRNGQHIGPNTSIRQYTKTDLQKAFSVASDVKTFTTSSPQSNATLTTIR